MTVKDRKNPYNVLYEVSIYDRIMPKEELRQNTFLALKYKDISILSFLPNFPGFVKEFIPKNKCFAVCVDYPLGVSPTSVRVNAALLAIKNGAKYVDVPINHALYNITNNIEQNTKFIDDVLSLLEVCKKNNATLRMFMEYRLYESKENIVLGAILDEIGVDYVFPSTGFQMDDFDDNILIAEELTVETNLNVIVNAPFKKDLDLQVLQKSNVFGYRFNSVGLMKRFLKL